MNLLLGIAVIGWIIGGLVWAAHRNPNTRLTVVYILAFLLVMVIFSRYFGVEWSNEYETP